MKVVHLKLKEPHNGDTDFYFGSMKAIYDEFSHDEIGIGYKSLTNALRGKLEYENKKCTIKVGQLRQKKQSEWRPPHLSERERYETQCEIDEVGYSQF